MHEEGLEFGVGARVLWAEAVCLGRHWCRSLQDAFERFRGKKQRHFSMSATGGVGASPSCRAGCKNTSSTRVGTTKCTSATPISTRGGTCMEMRKGHKAPGVPHTAACRDRIERALGDVGDHRLATAEERVTEIIAGSKLRRGPAVSRLMKSRVSVKRDQTFTLFWMTEMQ